MKHQPSVNPGTNRQRQSERILRAHRRLRDDQLQLPQRRLGDVDAATTSTSYSRRTSDEPNTDTR
ncbi:hypothetical protein BRD20_05805 [Halobacteriales archaeon SW_8_65_20]|nr:MAG: hypothetical protein BRD20_05805 [Halobacteriales archaeon SW_8_65_20]